VTNQGSIVGTSDNGIVLDAGGTVTNSGTQAASRPGAGAWWTGARWLPW